MFNDVAVAVRALQAEGRIHRALVVDCDVHQGNGTAEIFAGDATVVTVDLYGHRNFPFEKVPAAVDVPLDDRTRDAEYLSRLEGALADGLGRGPFDVAFYVSGADPWEGDRLGRLSLTTDGLARRDATIFAALRDANLPVVVMMGGGYAADVGDTVGIHRSTVREALRVG